MLQGGIIVTFIGNNQNIVGASLMYTLIVKDHVPASKGSVVITVSTFPTKVMMLGLPIEVISKPILHAKGGHR